MAKWVKIPETELTKLINRLRVLEGRLDSLTKVLGLPVLGYTLLDNPAGFVLAVIIDFIVRQVLTAAGFVGNTIRWVYRSITRTLTTALELTLGSTGLLVAEIVSTIIGETDALIRGLVVGLGPFAPIAALLIWAALMGLITILIREGLTTLLGAVR